MNKLTRGMVATLGVVMLTWVFAPTSFARSTWDTTAVDVVHNPAVPPHVVNLRVGQHPTYDRVVIDLDGALPGYHVAYVDHLTYDASGASVPLKGTKFIRVVLRPAQAHNGHGDSVYTGPKLKQYTMPTLRGVAFTGDNEGVVSFGLALSRKANFRVFTLAGPNRLVIDLHH